MMKEYPTTYDKPLVLDAGYRGLFDFGAGGEIYAFQGPKGKKGRLLDVLVAATETFTNTTTGALIKIGTAADDDAYGTFNMAMLADKDCFVASLDAPTGFVTQELPADTVVQVTFVAPTGGTPAGMGLVSIPIAWF